MSCTATGPWSRHVAVVVAAVALASAPRTWAQPFFLSRTLLPAETEDFGVGDGFAVFGPDLVIGNTGRRVAGQVRAGSVDFVDPRTGVRLRSTPNPTPAANEAFGIQVAIAGSVIVTGAPFESGGTAYFVDGATGAILRTIPRPGGSGYFAGAVAAYGTRAVIGSDGGPVRVYDADPTSSVFGALVLTLPNPSGTTNDGFGRAVGTVGGNVLVGASFASFGYAGGVRAGAAYMFDGTTGALLRTFRTPQPDFNDFFGWRVLGVGTDVVISGLFDDGVTVDDGIVYVFDAPTGILLRTIQSPTPFPSESFGSSLAVVGSHLVVGESDDSNIVGPDAGALYVFDYATSALEQTIISPGIEGFGFTAATIGTGFVATGFSSPAAYLFSDDSCGNGAVGPFEECDDGNLTNGDGCDENCTVTGCGNRVVTAGEQCDDGNTATGDCCAPDCTFESAGAPCPDDGVLCYADECDGAGSCQHPQRPAGADCEADGNPCTQETCTAGAVCQMAFRPAGAPCPSDGNACTQDACNGAGACHHDPISCGACQACDPLDGCFPDLATGCQAPLPGKASLTLRTRTPDEQDLIAWKMRGSFATAPFGDPTASTSFEVCVFDQVAPTPHLLYGVEVPPAGICPGQLCWRPAADGFVYYDRGLGNAGMNRIRLKGGTAERGRLVARGRGPGLGLPPTFAITPPLVVQLRRPDTGDCWTSIFSAPDRNRSDLVKGRSD